MTTVQETPNGHRVSPPSAHDTNGIVSSDLSTGMPANKLHRGRGISLEPLSPRCQFTFSDGRQCTMARSDIHPSMCPFHAEREEQLFGSPSPGGSVVGDALDLPELYSACRDLTTAAGVNRALAQVFRLLARRRISRQEAATFGHLAQLLLRTITLARAESADPNRERRIPPNPAPARDFSPAFSPVCESVPSQHRNGAPAPQPHPASVDSSLPVPAPSSEPLAGNSSEINTSENVELKTLQNEHLREMHGTERDAKGPIPSRSAPSSPPLQGRKDGNTSNCGGDSKT